MVNTVFREHIINHPQCMGNLNFDSTSEQKRGLVWRERAVCNHCDYTSRMFVLYNEVDTGKCGRKSADINMMVQIGMTQTSISATSFNKILLSAGLDAPSVPGLQKSANKINPIIENANQQDMKSRRKLIRKINLYKNQPENEISGECDGVYNNSLYSGVGRTPFQPATQAVLSFAENETVVKQILAIQTVNKLCSKHGFHSLGDEPCDKKSGQCTATASMETNIGDEQKWADMCFRDLLLDDLEVKYLTTDGDTKAFQAAKELYEKKLTKTVPEHLLDTRHLSETHRKQLKNSQNVLNMMPGRTKAVRLALRNKFAVDISKRCHAEFKFVHKQEKGNFKRLTKRINKCIFAVKGCYTGDHRQCKSVATVCNGEITDNWIFNSPFLPKWFKINSSHQENAATLLQCIEYRLSDDTLRQTKLNTNSQKVEATNRCIKRSLPKNCTFTRNFSGRAHSAIHSVNNGPGDSVRKLCEAVGCPIPPKSKASRGLNAIQTISENKKQREKSLAYKIKRKYRRIKMYALHEKHSETRNYIHGQLMKRFKVREKLKKQNQNPQQSTSSEDHSYPRNPSNNQLVRAKKHGGSCCPTHE